MAHRLATSTEAPACESASPHRDTLFYVSVESESELSVESESES